MSQKVFEDISKGNGKLCDLIAFDPTLAGNQTVETGKDGCFDNTDVMRIKPGVTQTIFAAGNEAEIKAQADKVAPIEGEIGDDISSKMAERARLNQFRKVKETSNGGIYSKMNRTSLKLYNETHGFQSKGTRSATKLVKVDSSQGLRFKPKLARTNTAQTRLR